MIISQSPQNYQASFNELLYKIEKADPRQIIDVEILGPQQSSVVGAKRFKGENSYYVNVANYLLSQFDIEPITADSCRIVASPKRLSSISIRVAEGVCSPESWHTFGIVDALPLRKLSDSPQCVRIAPGQSDEISLLAPDCQVSAVVWLYGIGVEHQFTIEAVEADHNMLSIVISMEDIAARLVAAGYTIGQFSDISVVASANGIEFLAQDYTITPQRKSEVRLCWINRYGAIDYYTFAGYLTKSVAIETNRVYAQCGYKSVGAQSEAVWKIASEYEPQKSLEWLAEIIAAPRIWIVEGGQYTPVCVRSHSVVTHSDDLSRAELSISPIKKTLFQRD